MFDELPSCASWRHRSARDGFEVVFIRRMRRGWRFEGHTTAVEDGQPWAVRYRIAVDSRWRTRTAQVWSRTASGSTHRRINGDGTGRWTIDGALASHLDGCLDVDLESSACTNTFPVHRLPSEPDRAHDVPAAYVRVHASEVERLEQRYTSRAEGVFDYTAPGFDFRCRLRYDGAGLVVDYPGIAERVA